MTNYDSYWGGTQKNWSRVSFQEKHFLNALVVFTWVGMVGVFVTLAFLFVTKANLWAGWMIFFMVLWLACGIAAIRIRRSKRKLVVFDKW